MSAARRDAEAGQRERQLSTSPLAAAAQLCEVVDVLPGAAADGRSLLVVSVGGEPLQVHRGRSYAAPTVGDLALVVVAQHVYVALDAVVGAPPET